MDDSDLSTGIDRSESDEILRLSQDLDIDYNSAMLLYEAVQGG